MSPTFRYLFREVWLRWRTRPSSPLARCILTFTLAAVAGGFLAGFGASRQALRSQLARLGFDTLVVRTALPGHAPTPAESLPASHWAAPMAASGQVLVLRQSPALAAGVSDLSIPIFSASWRTLSGLQADPRAPGVLLTNALPEGSLTPVCLPDGTSLLTAARSPRGPWRALVEGDALVIPPGLDPAAPGAPSVEVVLFTSHEPDVIAGWAGAVRRLPVPEGEAAPVLQDPTPLRASLAALERGQRLWRLVILGLLGLGVVLVYGAIGVLEYRETRFGQALLRSFGVSAPLLWLAAFAENIFIANVSLVASILAVDRATNAILPHLPAFDLTSTALLSTESCLFLALIVNAGVLLSLLPLARALRRPIGVMLA